MGSQQNDDEELGLSITMPRKTLVIGPAHHDTSSLALKELLPGGHTSPADVTRSFGGTGYNIASNLVNLWEDPIDICALLTVLSGDSLSGLIRKCLQQLGGGTVPIHFLTIPDYPTASYSVIRDPSGNKHTATMTGDIYDQVSLQRLEAMASIIREAENLIIDSSFPEEIYNYLALIAAKHRQFIGIVLSSLHGAHKVAPLLSNCNVLCGNVEELSQLAQNFSTSEAGVRDTLHMLSQRGTNVKDGISVFATDRNHAFAVVNGKSYKMKAQQVDKVVSAHGANMFASVILHGVMVGKPTEEVIKDAMLATTLHKQGQQVNRDTLRAAQEQQKTENSKLLKRLLQPVFAH